jgi:DNA damage-inducible protein 1
MRLIDKRYAGIAKGVGTSKIVGRVHAVDMKIGSSFIPVSITVLENNDMEFLFGLDNLRRHQVTPIQFRVEFHCSDSVPRYQCVLDLKDNVLRIGEDAVPFLAEGDIPLHLRESESGEDPMDTDAGASGAKATGATAAGGAAQEFPQASIDSLIGMGFTREQAVMALRGANGNAELAASLLFGGD